MFQPAGGDIDGLWAQVADINRRLRELAEAVKELNEFVYNEAGLKGNKSEP